MSDCLHLAGSEHTAERAECRGISARGGSGRESPVLAQQLGKALPDQPPQATGLSTETAALSQFADIRNHCPPFLEFLPSLKSETHGGLEDVLSIGPQRCQLSAELPMSPLTVSKSSHMNLNQVFESFGNASQKFFPTKG